MESSNHTSNRERPPDPSARLVNAMTLRCRRLSAIVTAAALIGACSTGPSLLSVGTLPAADQIGTTAPPTMVYAAIAQKALTCWLGPKGPLKSSHIFHADAASPSRGGGAEIALHERDLTQVHPWGVRAFKIELAGDAGTGTRISMQNIKLPRDLADALRADVVTWAQGSDGCQAQIVRPPAPEPPPAAPAKTKTKKSRSG